MYCLGGEGSDASTTEIPKAPCGPGSTYHAVRFFLTKFRAQSQMYTGNKNSRMALHLCAKSKENRANTDG
jgi:hypothetical protein